MSENSKAGECTTLFEGMESVRHSFLKGWKVSDTILFEEIEKCLYLGPSLKLISSLDPSQYCYSVYIAYY